MDARTVCESVGTASAFLRGLGPLALAGTRVRPEQLSYYAGAFDPLWVESLYLPVADGLRPGQTVALVDGPDFHREADPAEAARAYGERPRTRVYESLDVRSDGWWSLATLHLAGMLRRRVICTAYESQAGDSNLGAHDDAWLGLIVQMRGTKRWTIWPTRDHPPEDVVMRTGDVMILPQGMTHQVSTPEEPGHSLHLLFAVTDEPISSAPGPARSAAGAA